MRICRCFAIVSLLAWCALGAPIVVNIETTNLAQEIDGFGASLTDSSAWLLRYGVPSSLASNVIRSLFCPTNGIGLNVLRQPMGASDFRLQDYTYDDMPPGQTDYALTNFSIAYETNYIIPLLRQIANVQTNLKIIGTPWSPPAWMKTSEHLYHGSLNTNAFPALAVYFRKYVQAYAAAGLPIYAVTLQNEPNYQSYTYPSMLMTPTQQTWLVKLLHGEFTSNNISTKILIYDHNWDQFNYALSVLSDTAAAACIAGVAFHGYAGDPSVQTIVQDAYPSKEIYFTESSGGAWSGSFTNSLMWDAENLIIGALRYGARTVIKWNLVLDQNGGPKLGGGCETCRGLLTIDTNTLAIVTNSEFYALAHVSKFLKPGARCMVTKEENSAPALSVAFRNPDQTFVLVAYNPAPTDTVYTIRTATESLVYPLPRQSLATFVWSNTPRATVDVWITTADRTRLLQKQTNVVSFAPRSIQWKGFKWLVADTLDSLSGNVRSPSCVSVDTNGNLRLTVQRRIDRWFSSEVRSEDSPTFGTYRWYVVGRPDLLHTNIVASWGTHADSFHALQTEVTRAYEEPPTNLFFTVQPYYLENHRYAGAHSLTGSLTTWEMTWTPRRVSYRAWYGHSTSPPSPTTIFAQWSYEGSDVPSDTNEAIYLSLWMFENLPPTVSQEVIFADFAHEPATGVIFQDEFNDESVGNQWELLGAATSNVFESAGRLTVTPSNTDSAVAGIRTVSSFPCLDDGFTRTFTFRLTQMTVSQVRTAGGVDLWAYQALVSGSNALYDAWSASNAITLRVGFDLESNTLRVELLAKTNLPNAWGQTLFAAQLANATSFFDAVGLDFQLSLVYSNYAVAVTRNGNPIGLVTLAGQSTGIYALGQAFALARYVLAVQNSEDGRGSASFDQSEGIVDATLESTLRGPSSDGGGVTIVQVGQANPANNWRAPIDTSYTRHRTTVLYKAGDIGRSGIITQMWIYVLSAPTIPLSNFCVRLQHTSAESLGNTFVNSGWTTARYATIQIPTNFTGWFPIPFTAPFEYNAKSNLLVDFAFSNITKTLLIPATTWTPTDYSAALVVSVDKTDPLIWSSPPSGRKYYYYGSRLLDIRFGFATPPPLTLGSNLSFEAGPAGFLTNLPGWTVSGSPYAGVVRAGFAFHGSQSLKLWKNPESAVQGVYQFFVPTTTNSYVLRGYILSQSGEPFEGLNAYGALRLEWFGPNGLLTMNESAHFTAGFENDIWHAFSVTGTPPTGTTSGRFSCVLVSSEDQKGSLYFDRIEITPVQRVSAETGTLPIARITVLHDDFNDPAMSNIWQYTGNWDGALFQETNGLLRVRPGTNYWQSSGYVTVAPISWNNTSSWYVFAASLATVRVDQASGTNDIEVLLGICSAPDNPWWVTNSCGLYGYYDQTADRLIVQLLLKTDRPAQSGTERFNATFTNISRILNGTNRLWISIALGENQYEVQFNDANGWPVPYTLNSGSPRGLHYLGDKLNEAHWLVGAQADWNKRGDVFWDETVVFRTDGPRLTWLQAEQATDGSGKVALTQAISDSNGDPLRLFVEASTNGGATWFRISASDLTADLPATLTSSQQLVHVRGISVTNAAGLVVSNRLTLLWDTRADGLDNVTLTHALIRVWCDDAAVSTPAVTSQPFMIDNEAPDARYATVVVESNRTWTFNEVLHVVWTGFVDIGSGIAGYFVSPIDGSGTTNGIRADSSEYWHSDLTLDATNTLYVWAQDARGNIGRAVTGSIVVLSLDGDFDRDGLPNATEISYSCNPILFDSDDDGVPDGWEVHYGLDPTNSADAAEDVDNDGYPNRAEFLCGTDPTNSASQLDFRGNSAPTNRSFILQWLGATGRTYAIYSGTVANNDWAPEPTGQNLIGVQGLMSWTGQIDTLDYRHYRLKVHLLPSP